MNLPSSPPPQYEPGGNRMLIVIALIVVTALGGIIWTTVSRQNAPHDATAIKARYLPPSAQPDTGKQATGAVAAPRSGIDGPRRGVSVTQSEGMQSTPAPTVLPQR
ncbi:MAG: hypothetical protein Q8O52_14240 [Sulfuritalea sp.]|nr:hypothetical protein [Sulfuritalea sp.]